MKHSLVAAHSDKLSVITHLMKTKFHLSRIEGNVSTVKVHEKSISLWMRYKSYNCEPLLRIVGTHVHMKADGGLLRKVVKFDF